jgi:hypothetical protein
MSHRPLRYRIDGATRQSELIVSLDIRLSFSPRYC